MIVVPQRGARLLKFSNRDEFERVLRFVMYLQKVGCPYAGDLIEVNEEKMQIKLSKEGKRYLRDDEIFLAQVKLSVYGVYIKNPNRKDFEFDGDDILIRAFDKLRLIRTSKVASLAMEIIWKKE